MPESAVRTSDKSLQPVRKGDDMQIGRCGTSGNVVLVVLFAVLAALAGCSSSNGSKESTFSPDTGHPAGWSAPSSHGATAKAQAQGFFSCQACHGNDFSGGISSVACSSCHGVNAPHAPAPWRGGAFTHTNTNPSNAPICAQCHLNGANSSVQPSPPAQQGTPPGCFNNTLCHATPGHPAGWSDPAQHGVAAKAAPSSTGGFAHCESCHGTDFTGGTAQTACSSCHGVNAPHPPAPWRDTTYTHATTDPGNAAVCAQCHTNGANSSVQPSPPAPQGTAPGCFNNTLCHATQGHPAGWSDPTQHGVAAKAAPTSTGGFSLCETCHGSDFTGGTAQTACSSCHGVNAPHPPAPWRDTTYTHTTTDPGNAAVCAQCHTDGANSSVQPSPPAPQGTAPGCFNNTLCHATPTCGSCHGIPPDGTVFPNVAGSHAPHMAVNASVACGTCHNGAGSGTALHQNGVVDVILDTTYNANSGAAAYDSGSLTCSNIACHGSSRTQTSTQANANPPQSTPGPTPVWGSGTINVNTQCTLCHVLGSGAGIPENNSYYSGQHRRHVYGQGFACTNCHDTTKLAPVHFTSLTAPISESTAATTLNSSLNFNGTTCNPGCHGQQTW
jgi:predicted CxxxxCH...CXXCH cytochrome family protein